MNIIYVDLSRMTPMQAEHFMNEMLKKYKNSDEAYVRPWYIRFMELFQLGI